MESSACFMLSIIGYTSAFAGLTYMLVKKLRKNSNIWGYMPIVWNRQKDVENFSKVWVDKAVERWYNNITVERGGEEMKKNLGKKFSKSTWQADR